MNATPSPREATAFDLFQEEAPGHSIETTSVPSTDSAGELDVIGAPGDVADPETGISVVELSQAAPSDPVVDADLAPPAPRAVDGDPSAAGVANLTAAPDAEPLPLPSQPLPLPDFLEGAGPLWLAQQPAAPYLEQNDRTAESAGSQLMTIQTEPMAPVDNRASEVLRRIEDINPFFDYTPEGDDPCEFLCPTPSICADDYLCPEELPIPESGPPMRAHMNFYWAASNVFHNPLYFEDPVLERYGQVHCNDAVQPFFSMARFSAQLIGLPYQMALDPVHDRVYPLGLYRPGDPAPELIYQPPLNARAGAISTGVYTGLFFLVP